MGELLEKNIATFRCYENISQAKYYVSPHPFQKFSHKTAKETPKPHTDSRRELTARFGYRERLGSEAARGE